MISIVIVNWNAGRFLEQCVQSLRVHAGECETIVVDNASRDGSLDFVSRIEANLRIQRNHENLGFGAANNVGWRLSKGDPVLFLNPDIECLEGSVQRLSETFTADTKTWAAGGLLSSPSGKHQVGFNVRGFPTIGGVAAEMLLLDEIWSSNPWTRRYRMSGWDHASAREVDQPAAACLMVRRSALEYLDGFDERFYPAWFEDVDLCKRIRDAGARVFFQPAARFVHHGGSSLGRLPRGKFLEYYHLNQIRYFAKHHGRETAARVRRLIVAGMRLRAILSYFRPVVPGARRAESARIFLQAAARISSRQAEAA